MQFSIRQEEEKPLAYRCGLPAFRTEKRRGFQLFKLFVPRMPTAHHSILTSKSRALGLVPQFDQQESPEFNSEWHLQSNGTPLVTLMGGNRG